MASCARRPTTYDQPYSLARRFASLDLISGGRAGWNLVTSANRSEADSFGLAEHVEKSERYRRAREFAQTVRGLWNSWGDDAFVRDKRTGIYFDRDRLQVMEHAGEFFRVRGPLNVSPSPQGEPVLVQAGASDDGRALAAETAEVIFGAQQTLAGAQAFYADVKARMAAHGRDPDGLRIMPGLLVALGRTHDEAVDKYEALQELIDPLTGLQLLSKRLDYDLSGYPIDGPLPDIPRNATASTRVDLFVEIARREKLTIRDLYRRVAGARGHCEIVGTPVEIADMMEEWVTGRRATVSTSCRRFSRRACGTSSIWWFPSFSVAASIEQPTPERRCARISVFRARPGRARPGGSERRQDGPAASGGRAETRRR